MQKKPKNHAIFFFINNKISCLIFNFYLMNIDFDNPVDKDNIIFYFKFKKIEIL